jgi:phytoene synthase
MNKIKLGFKEAKKITRDFAKTFYFASLFLPKDKRLASYAIYAICRLSDEAADDNGLSQKEKRIEEIKNKIDLSYSGLPIKENLLIAFRDTVNKYNIPKEHFYELLEGMRMDLRKKRYSDIYELKLYSYRVAGVVGLIMLKIFGYSDKNAETYALKLGEAMQLTNILRDIKEDLQKGRLYLPLNELKEFNLTEKEIEEMRVNENFKSLMKFQIKRARESYKESRKGVSFIKCLRSRLAIRSMQEIYSGILKEIENNNYDVFSRRAAVNTPKKIWMVIKILLKGPCP